MKSYVTSLLIMFPIDLIWLTLTKKVYDNWLSPFERVLNIPAAILVYLFIPFGLAYLVISRNSGDLPNSKVIMDAFVYGVCAYSVYDLTNLATLKGWSVPMVIVDIIWGGVLCSMVTYVSLLVLNKI